MHLLGYRPGCILSPGTPLVLAPLHHISPPLDEQLVLELEAWIVADEAVDVLLDPMGRTQQLALGCSSQPGRWACPATPKQMTEQRRWLVLVAVPHPAHQA